MNVNRTILIPAALAPLARILAAGLSQGGVGMFETPLYQNGQIIYYVSSGQIDTIFDVILPLWKIIKPIDINSNETISVNPPTQTEKDRVSGTMYDAIQKQLASSSITSNKSLSQIPMPNPLATITLAQCQELVDQGIVVDCDIENAQETFTRLGLNLFQTS